MKKFFTILLLLTGAELIPVSCLCPCGCGFSSDVKDFDILSFGIETTSLDNIKLDTSSFHVFDEVFKAFFVDDKIDISQNTKPFIPGAFVSNAYACSPKEPSAIQKISDVKIISRIKTTLADANDLVNVGDDLSGRFGMSSRFYNPDFRPFAEFNDDLIFLGDRFRIRLNQKPFQETKLLFDIVITLSDGKRFELKNEILKVR